MIIEFDHSNTLVMDLGMLNFWITSGKPSDEHPPTGACVRIGYDGVCFELTPENAKRLQANLNLAIIAQEAGGDALFDHPAVKFVKPDTRET